MGFRDKVMDVLRGLGCSKCDVQSVPEWPRKIDIVKIAWKRPTREVFEVFINDIFMGRMGAHQANLLYSLAYNFPDVIHNSEPGTINKAREKIGIGPVPGSVPNIPYMIREPKPSAELDGPANSDSDALRSAAVIVDELKQYNENHITRLRILDLVMDVLDGGDIPEAPKSWFADDLGTKDKSKRAIHAIHTGFVTGDLEPIVIEKEKTSGLFFVYVVRNDRSWVQWKPEGGPSFNGGKTAEEAREWFDQYPKGLYPKTIESVEKK